MKDSPTRCFAVAAPGLETAVLTEVRELGLPAPNLVDGGVEFDGGLWAGMKACLWLRCATSVRLRLAEVPAKSERELAEGLRKIPWFDVLPMREQVALQVTASRSRMKHTGRLAEVVAGAAPGVRWTKGSEGVHLRLHRDRAEVSLELAGVRLHQRGWRLEGGAAPLRETLAAGVLRLCGWQPEEPLVDPMCGSGTLVIEAALLATRTAPGLNRTFAFEGLPDFDARAWRALRQEAEGLRRPAPAPLVASDVHPGAVGSATRNAQRAGIAILVERRDLSQATPPPDAGPGLLVTNPPYGARVGARGGDLVSLYETLGEVARTRFPGWRVGILASDPRLVAGTRLALDEGLPLRSGGLQVRLWQGPSLPTPSA